MSSIVKNEVFKAPVGFVQMFLITTVSLTFSTYLNVECLTILAPKFHNTGSKTSLIMYLLRNSRTNLKVVTYNLHLMKVTTL